MVTSSFGFFLLLSFYRTVNTAVFAGPECSEAAGSQTEKELAMGLKIVERKTCYRKVFLKGGQS
jgi:hypothetical protein